MTDSASPADSANAAAAEEIAEAAALLAFLEAQRASVLAIIDGLDAVQLATTVLPSGWTPLGLIEHLDHAERHWFQDVATGSAMPLPWPEDPDENDDAADEHHEHADDDHDTRAVYDAAFTTKRPAEVVFAFYRDQIERADAVTASTPLSSLPIGQHNGDGAEDVTDLRSIVLHMIEETARHLGHLDVVRELLDGRTGLGPR